MTQSTGKSQAGATLTEALERNRHTVARLTAGMPEDKAAATLVPGGSHMNWLIGHLVGNRDAMLRTLGLEGVRSQDDDESFGYGSAAEASVTLSLAQQLAHYEAASTRLAEAVADLSAAQLAAPSGGKTVRERLDFFMWHETYHLGQLMLYRRAAGLDNPIG